MSKRTKKCSKLFPVVDGIISEQRVGEDANREDERTMVNEVIECKKRAGKEKKPVREQHQRRFNDHQRSKATGARA